jgi:hypothetical protein
MKEAKGKALETRIADILTSQLPGVGHMQRDKKIKVDDGILRWQLDIGFLYEGILFLIEAKNWVMKVKYYLDSGVEVSSRVSQFESLLEDLDDKLFKFKHEVRNI